MHVSVLASLDLNWFLQLVFSAFLIVLGLLHLVKNTASKYFEVDADFDPQANCVRSSQMMPGVSENDSACALCGTNASRRCSGCKVVRYCSPTCQSAHWGSGHSKKCREFQLAIKRTETINDGKRRFFGDCGDIALVPASGNLKICELTKKILFPYDEFVELFNCRKPGFSPCGLLNCGNSCFANVVLQCLTFTRPLVSYLLEKGHQRECKRNDWCFLCEFQTHVERASRSFNPFSPLSILSRLPNMGGNFGYGRQEDAHEFMRFAIDTMQSVCLDEFGGEKSLHPSAQETSLIQHTFGGHLQSQVICSECNKISNQYENMMDLTVEIQGDAASLEECLNQFTVREWLHGDNMYKCDGCNGYVKASKCLTIRRAPNILTIALKRFQSGRFGKLNKRVSFPETFDLTPYMSEPGDGTDVYMLYAVVVHMDMLNASFFGHYICYIKDFMGDWYRVDDDKVRSADLEEVLSQGAYMLLYSRVRARSSCLSTIEPLNTEHNRIVEIAEKGPCPERLVDCYSTAETNGFGISSELASPNSDLCSKLFNCEESGSEAPTYKQDSENVANMDSVSSVSKDVEACGDNNCEADEIVSHVGHAYRSVSSSISSSKISSADSLHSPSTDNEDIRSNRQASLSNLPETPVPTDIGVFENGEVSWDMPVSGSSSVTEVSVEMDASKMENMPHSLARKLEMAKSGEVSPKPGINIEESGKELSGRLSSSEVKMKPLFSPGFLTKRPRNNLVKRDGNPTTDFKFSNCNGYAMPSVRHQVSGETKAQVEVHSDCNTLSSPASVADKHQECANPDEMVVDVELAESVNLCNGDAASSTSNIKSDASCVHCEDYLLHRDSACSFGVPSAQQCLTKDAVDHDMNTPF